MNNSIKELINQAISEENIRKSRKYLENLESILLDSNKHTKWLPSFLGNLLEQENFLDLGGAIYVISIAPKLLGKIPKAQEQEYIKIFRLAQAQFDCLEFDFIKKLIYQLK